MPEEIKKLSLGEILRIPIDFTVTSINREIGFRNKFDTVLLENEELGLSLYLTDEAYGELVEEVNVMIGC